LELEPLPQGWFSRIQVNKQQNRMNPISSFREFGAHLREFIRRHSLPPQTASAAGDAEFDALASALFSLQYRHHAPYRAYVDACGLAPETGPHWSTLPAVPTAAFKDREFTSLLSAERMTVFQSSGTTEHRPSRHFHDAISLPVYEASLWPWFQAHLLPEASRRSPEAQAIPLIILTPSSSAAPHSSLAYMFDTVRQRCGAPATVFCGRIDSAGIWQIDLEAVRAALRTAVEQDQPVLLLGTAFSFVDLLDRLAALSQTWSLPVGSRALETGGYKNRSRALPKSELYALIGQRLGLPTSHVVSEYGMCELSSQAYDGTVPGPMAALPSTHEERVFRFPPWARVQVVSPETGREVGEGELGLIKVVDLANIRSVMAVLTADLGERRGDGFILRGRAEPTEPRGCSLMA
jgi:hypothetical protein